MAEETLKMELRNLISNIGHGEEWYSKIRDLDSPVKFRDFMAKLLALEIDISEFHAVLKQMGRDCMLYHKSTMFVLMVQAVETTIQLYNEASKRVDRQGYHDILQELKETTSQHQQQVEGYQYQVQDPCITEEEANRCTKRKLENQPELKKKKKKNE